MFLQHNWRVLILAGHERSKVQKVRTSYLSRLVIKAWAVQSNLDHFITAQIFFLLLRERHRLTDHPLKLDQIYPGSLWHGAWLKINHSQWEKDESKIVRFELASFAPMLWPLNCQSLWFYWHFIPPTVKPKFFGLFSEIESEEPRNLVGVAKLSKPETFFPGF